MDVEVVDEELQDYRSWLSRMYCGQELLGGWDPPFVVVDARFADVEKVCCWQCQVKVSSGGDVAAVW